MTSENILLVADARGHILERLGRAWIRYGRCQQHEMVCSAEMHSFQLRQFAEKRRLVHWIDPLAYAAYPNAARVPQVVMVHHLTEPEMAPMLERLCYADFITTSSQRWRSRLASMTPWDPIVIPYSVDVTLFMPREKAIAAARLGLSAGRYVIGFSAKAQANAFGRKGIDVFLEVLRLASRRWSDLAVLLIGHGWEDLKSLIELLDVEVIHVKPNRTEETAEFYPAMDVFLCTSNEEGGPCTVLEAMSCQVPAISTDVGHIPEVIADGVNGFVVQKGDVNEFVRIIGVLRANAEMARSVGAEARHFILRERDERVAMRHVDFDTIYRAAEANFRRRTRSEVYRRAFPLLYLRMRYGASRAAHALGMR